MIVGKLEKAQFKVHCQAKEILKKLYRKFW
jgi:hypothetical protein